MADSADDRFARELDLVLRVPYPIVVVRAAEEHSARAVIDALAAHQRRAVYTWSATAPTRLADELERLRDEHTPAVCVFVEPGDALADPLVLRRLQELADDLESRDQTIVLLGAGLTVPTALARVATLLDAPLPTREALGDVLDQTLPPDAVVLLPRERMVAAALGLTRGEARRAFLRARLAHHDAGQPLAFEWERVVLDEKRRALSNDDVARYVDVDENLGEVGGLDELKDWLETRKAAFSAEARDFGLPAPRGLLLIGVQGCGKSLTAKAVARHWGLPLLRLDLGAVFGGRLAPDAALHRALDVAEAIAPCVLWTDEIEKGLGDGLDPVGTRVLGTLLTWLQEKRSEVFFVATANEVHQLPPELLRKGRFDEMFFVDLPDRGSRARILAIHLRKRARAPERFDLDTLAGATEHFSGAELEQVIIAGLYEAFAEARELTDADLIHAAEQIVPLYATREDAIKKLREWARTRARPAARDQRLVDFFSPP